MVNRDIERARAGSAGGGPRPSEHSRDAVGPTGLRLGVRSMSCRSVVGLLPRSIRRPDLVVDRADELGYRELRVSRRLTPAATPAFILVTEQLPGFRLELLTVDMCYVEMTLLML